MSCKRASIRWIFDCSKWHPTRKEWMVASSSVQLEEKERIGRFFFKRDAKNSMAGRLLMRKFLTVHSGLPWKAIDIRRAEHGKPYLANTTEMPLNFNISHHGNYAVLAGEVGDYKVGIDVMSIEYKTGDGLKEFFRLMQRQLSNDEWNLIEKVNHSERDKCRIFYRFWCLKESYLKAIGSGLTESLKEVSFDIKDMEIGRDKFTTSTEVSVQGERLQNWSFQEIMIDADTFVTVAISPGKEVEVQSFQALTFKELVEEAEEVLTEDEEYCDAFFAKQNFPNDMSKQA